MTLEKRVREKRKCITITFKICVYFELFQNYLKEHVLWVEVVNS